MSYATKEQLQELAAYMASQINVPTIGVGGGYAPVGTIISFMGTTAPQDYLACDGSTKNIADYPQLAAFFESQFGSKSYFGGNGTTTFAVPDLRGEFLRGTGTNGHTNQGNGAAVGAHQDATDFPYFAVNPGNGTSDGTFDSARFQIKSKVTSGNTWKSSLNKDYITSGKGFWTNYYSSASGAETTVGTESFTSRPTNTSILWCIKATSVNENMDTTGSVYITKPNTWTPNVEYNFGDGVYGQRKTGTITTNAENTYVGGANLKSSVNYLYPISFGGYFEDGYVGAGVNIRRAPGCVCYNDAGTGILSRCSVDNVMIDGESRILFRTWSAANRTNAAFDFWVLYTKTPIS